MRESIDKALKSNKHNDLKHIHRYVDSSAKSLSTRNQDSSNQLPQINNKPSYNIMNYEDWQAAMTSKPKVQSKTPLG